MLMRAAAEDKKAVVALLLEHGAALELQQRQGTTALMFAAYAGNTLVVKRLLDAAADPGTRDNKGLRAEDYSRVRGHAPVSMMLAHRAEHPSAHELSESAAAAFLGGLNGLRFPGKPLACLSPAAARVDRTRSGGRLRCRTTPRWRCCQRGG